MESWQKILPNQEFNANLYNVDGVAIEESIFDLILEVSDLKVPQETFSLETSEIITVEEMASSPVTLGFLQWLIDLRGVRSVLEIGAFIGVSAMYMARALPQDGRVLTIEKFEKFADIALRNFERNQLSDKIELRNGDASDILPDVVGDRRFDLVFIDGHKEAYAEYLDLVVDAVTDRGIVIIDDALFHGDVLNKKATTEKGAGVHAALMRAKEKKNWRLHLLPISNGMLLMTKRPDDAGGPGAT